MPERARPRFGVIPDERIRPGYPERLPAEVIARFLRLEGATATLADALDELGLRGAIGASRLRPLRPGERVAGQVTTLRYLPERASPDRCRADGQPARLADRDAYAAARRGDVVVIDAGGEAGISAMGDLSARVAQSLGIAATIVDGGIRDADVVRALGYPVWSRGITPLTGKHRLEAVEINGPVRCAGVQVRPGDLAVADDTGIVFIPPELALRVLERVEAAAQREQEVVAGLSRGASIDELRRILPPERW